MVTRLLNPAPMSPRVGLARLPTNNVEINIRLGIDRLDYYSVDFSNFSVREFDKFCITLGGITFLSKEFWCFGIMYQNRGLGAPHQLCTQLSVVPGPIKFYTPM